MTRIAKAGDIYCLQSTETNKWGAYQVIKEEEDKVALLTLDWFSEKPPTADDLLSLKPLLMERYSWNKKMHYWYTRYKAVPKEFIYVGNIKPLIDNNITTYSDWPGSLSQDAEEEFIWQQYSKVEREKFKNAVYSYDLVTVHGKTMKRDEYRIFLHESVFPRPLGLPNEIENFCNWEELDKLGALKTIEYNGNSTGVISYIGHRIFINTLTWENHSQNEIDISHTYLKSLIVDLKSLKKLILNDKLSYLYLSGNDFSKVKVIHPHSGLRLGIKLNLKNKEIPNLHLPELSSLSLTTQEIDAEKIAAFYPNLNALSIWGNPGYIRNIDSLGKLTNLRWLQLNNLFGFTAEQFPSRNDLGNIENLWLTSIPADVAIKVKKDYRDCMEVNISKPRSEGWLEANLNNPFRDWDSRERIAKKQAKAAGNAYVKALQSLNKLDVAKNNIEEVKTILHEFVAAFNQMKCIETVEREEIADAYSMLLRKITFANDSKNNLIMGWFEEWREF